MKATPLQPKYRYFVGIELPNTEQNDPTTSQRGKSKTPIKGTDRLTLKRGGDTPKNKSSQNEGKDNNANLKAKYADGYMSGQVKYDYALILTQKNNKNLPENSPINKLSPVKLQQAIQEANQTKKISKKEPVDVLFPDHKQNKQPAIYLPFSPKQKITEFYEPQPLIREQNFVNPYYQPFILQRKNNKERNTNEKKMDKGSEAKVQIQRDKSPKSIATNLSHRNEKMYICKMDHIEHPSQQPKTKPKKDNSPYLLNYYQNNPQVSAIRYNASPHPIKTPNRKTNQIYARIVARLADEPSHH